MTIQDANAKKDYANKHSDSKKLALLDKQLIQTGPPLGEIFTPSRKRLVLTPQEKEKRIQKYYERTASDRDKAKTNIPVKTNGPNMKEKFREKTIAKVKDMISKAKEKEKIK